MTVCWSSEFPISHTLVLNIWVEEGGGVAVCGERGMRCMQRALWGLSDGSSPPGRARRAGCWALTFPLCLSRHSWGVGEWGKIISGAAQSHPLFMLSLHQVATKCRKLSGLTVFDQPWEDRELVEELVGPKFLHSWSTGAPKGFLLDREPHRGGGTLISLVITSPAGQRVPQLLQTKLNRDALAKWAFAHAGH